MDDGSGNTRYCYDRRGNVVRKVQTTNGQVFTLVYGYTLANQLASVTYPSGLRVDYTHNALGQPSGVTVTQPGQTAQVLLTSVTYYPFGPAAELEYGDGRRLKRTHNQNYQPGVIEDVGPDGLSLGYEFDPVGNLIKLRKGDQSEPPLRAYAYDKLGRLTETRDGTSNALLQGYTYDATGNRTSKTDAGATQTYTYPTTGHRLSQVGATSRSYDAVGNTAAIGGTAQEFIYTAANRMGQVKQGGNAVMNYAYNGRGEQTRRYPTTTSTAQTYASYDESGHTVGIYDHTGNRIQEVIWLGDLPVGVIDTNKLHYVQADHLGTPRNVIDPVAEKSVWAWQLGNEAFGDSAPNQDPDNNGTAFVFDLRFPGQRYDAASGQNYNYFRDYESNSGRYGQSDPIGLDGGISTYGYVSGMPLTSLDTLGLLQFVVQPVTWNTNMTASSTYRSHPGRLAKTWGANVLAYTTFRWTVGAQCVCDGGQYKLDEIRVRIGLTVLAQTHTQLNPALKSWLQRAEGDHVSDFQTGMNGVKQGLQSLENSLKGVPFPNEMACLSAATNAASAYLGNSADQAITQSSNTHDVTGLHLWGGANQRP